MTCFLIAAYAFNAQAAEEASSSVFPDQSSAHGVSHDAGRRLLAGPKLSYCNAKPEFSTVRSVYPVLSDKDSATFKYAEGQFCVKCSIYRSVSILLFAALTNFSCMQLAMSVHRCG